MTMFFQKFRQNSQNFKSPVLVFNFKSRSFWQSFGLVSNFSTRSRSRRLRSRLHHCQQQKQPHVLSNINQLSGILKAMSFTPFSSPIVNVFSLLQRSRVTLSYERHTKPIREYTRDQRISFFTIRSYPVFEKWYPYPIRILFWLKSCYPYPRTNRKCIVIHNIHSCALSILPHEAK